MYNTFQFDLTFYLHNIYNTLFQHLISNNVNIYYSFNNILKYVQYCVVTTFHYCPLTHPQAIPIEIKQYTCVLQ